MAKKLLKDKIPDRIDFLNSINKVARQGLHVGCEYRVKNIGNLKSIIDEIKEPGEQTWQILLDEILEYFFISQRRPLREIQNILEKAILIKVLSRVNGNQRRAAKFLGIKNTTLGYKIKKHNIKFQRLPIGDKY